MNRSITSSTAFLSPASRIGAFISLWKPRLSLVVAFSSVFGYVLGTPAIDWRTVVLLFFGGFLISGAAVTINQIMEIDYDRVMERTKNRALPSGRLSVNDARIFTLFSGISGLILLWISTNPLTMTLSLISLILYAFLYTPLKRVGPVAVFVGAIPGALPPLIGWAAATGGLNYMAFIIFGIQFIWQFPHFWAIAWVADDDYRKAGFRLLPNSGKKDMNTAFQIMIYALFLIPISMLPAWFGLTGINSAFIAVVSGTLFLSLTLALMQNPTRKAALKIMFASFIYLPIIQLAFIMDKL